MKKLMVFAGILMMALLFSSRQVAHAEEIECTGTLGQITVDNVLVPDGATCTLNRTTVEGTVYVGTGSTLRSTRALINGNVQAEGAKLVRVVKGSVGGSIQIVQGDSALVYQVNVTQDILFDSNDRRMTADENIVGGNIQAFQNTGGVIITDNTVDGNLQCTGNNPAPTGGGNIVHGTKENQCENL